MQELIQVNKAEAVQVLDAVDGLINKVDQALEEAGNGFIDLSFLLLQVKRGAFWTERGHHSEQEYIEKVFPQSRAQYYSFIRFATYLGKYPRPKLKGWGRSKCEDLCRLEKHFSGEVPEEWIQHINEDNKDNFRMRVRDFLDVKTAKELSERKAVESETGEKAVEDSFLTFKIFGNGIHTVNLALDTMKKIAGTDKSMGYLLELICANFNSQFADDGTTGHVTGKNAYILATIEGLVKQLDLKVKDTSEMLIGIIAKGVEGNVAS
jgi:hypothetical protein